MKTNKFLAALFATLLILTVWTSSSYAYGWNGKWSKSDSSLNLLAWVALQDLSEEEKQMLYYGYSEELLAHDMYMYFYDLYGVQTFKNIADSEARHMEAVKTLLERYALDIPIDYGELSDEFEVLKTQWGESLQKAFEVWVQIEILDIEDIAETIRTTDNDDLKIVFTQIWGASYNHLRGFLKGLTQNGFSTGIDYSDYLSESEVNTKWGALKSKMAEKLEAEWVDLPEQVNTTSIQKRCNWQEGKQQKGKNKISQVNKKQQGMYAAYYNSELKNQYALQYGNTLSQMSNEKLYILIERIDDLIAKVNSRDYSTIMQEKYNPILLVFRELVQEYID